MRNGRIILALLLIAALLSGCRNDTLPEREPGDPPRPESGVGGEEEAEKKILIAYFSRQGNTEYPDDIDATSSASLIDDGERFGTTEYLARLIREEIGGDLNLIRTAEPYTADYDELREVNHAEMASQALPELQDSGLRTEEYDIVFLGYPIWAMDAPRAVISFLDRYDLSGKTVIPFCTHAGYGAGSSYDTILEACGAVKTAEGLAVETEDVKSARQLVSDWLTSIGMPGREAQREIPEGTERGAQQRGRDVLQAPGKRIFPTPFRN